MRIEICPKGRIRFSTKGFNDIVDITDEVKKCVKEAGVKDGLCLIFLAGSTGALTTIEYEGGVVSDLLRALEVLAPMNDDYAHNRKWGDGNGFSHVRSALVKPSFTVPIEDGRPVLGKWQQIVFIDFDNKPRDRELILKVISSPKVSE
ncbi:MAG: YjbQ family protein [Candidatus Aenigmarchaeota archaeon]|nr:YjbQ family protein [Candidatus Aenigmarchaeota archaeon]